MISEFVETYITENIELVKSLPEKIELLKSFKERQISKILEHFNTKIFAVLNSPQFNPKIAEYFPKEKINTEGEPFKDYDEEPDNITQIKKLINALYHARLTFIDLENIDFSTIEKQYNTVKLLYSNTVHHGYLASYLITHLDVDLKGIFKDELSIILPLLAQFQDLGSRYSEQTIELTKQIKTYPLSYNVGQITGTTIVQMQPESGEPDYNFLTEFSAKLPGYIEQFTQYVKQYSSQMIENESKLNKEKLEELQNAGLMLLSSLEGLKGNDFYISLKFLNYIHIVRHVITLSMSTFEQIGNLSESSQNVIRDNLAELKYKVLPTLFGLVDKIEVHSMLEPGTLSNPLMDKIKPLYQLLINYASKPVNFKEKGEELLSIEDPRFISLRLELTYKRLSEAKKSKFKIQKAQKAFEDFYAIIEDPEYKYLCIHELPKDIKNKLIDHYKLIKPYMSRIDIDLNNELITSLQNDKSFGAKVYDNLLSFIKLEAPAGHMSFVLKRKEALRSFITKKMNTQLFHVNLNEYLIKKVHEHAKLALFPYNEKTNIFNIDESKALIQTNQSLQIEILNKTIAHPEKLSSEQALDMYQWYQEKHDKFMVAKKAYDDFIELLDDVQNKPNTIKPIYLNDLDESTKKRCINLYNCFQPYFIDALPDIHRQSAIEFDKYLVHMLKENEQKSKIIPIDLFGKMNEILQENLTKRALPWMIKSNFYLKLAKEKYHSENNMAKLELDSSIGSRTHHVIHHTNYSKCINEFRKALYQMTSMLNQTMQSELKITSSKLPYPELTDSNKTLAQSKQVIAIKQIFNALYHLEGFATRLEQLNNKGYELFYFNHLIQAYGHLYSIIKLTKSLLADPYFGFLAQDLYDKAQTLFAIFQEQSNAYQIDSEKIPYDESVKYNALWYIINAFHISPKHIRTLNENNYITTEEQEALHLNAKKATIKIEAIINNSSSYFTRFLQIPTMYSLFKELKQILREFTSTTHSAAMDNLEQINTAVFTPMLIEADEWEDKLGLSPGTLSSPLKQIIDEYYKGLIQSLNLPSKTHVSLICNKEPIEKRMSLTYKKIDNAIKHLDKIAEDFQDIETLYENIVNYTNLITKRTSESTFLVSFSEKKLISTYQKAIYKLAEFQEQFKSEPSNNSEEDLKLDQLLNESTKYYEAKPTQIKALVTSVHHYYLGLQATYQMQLRCAKEKLNYLTQLQIDQSNLDLLFIEEYTKESFNKQKDACCNRLIGLKFLYKEYREKLKANIDKFDQEIINEAKTFEDINLSIELLLKNKIKLFEEGKLIDNETDQVTDYHHLDAVKSVLAKFLAHLDSSSSTDELNKKKTSLIIKLDELASNSKLSVKERLKQIETEVKNPIFERIILTHKDETQFSFAYIKQLFLSLLEALHLYTPTRKKLFNELNGALAKKPELSNLRNRFGLFATENKTENLSSMPLNVSVITA